MEDRSKNDNNVYDIISYYKEDVDENPNTVNDVIDNIKKVNDENDCTTRVNKKKKLPKKLKWKLVGCILMNILLSSPIYGFVTIYLLHMDKFDRNIAMIWIPILFNAIYLLVTPWLFNTLISPTPVHVNSNAFYLTNRSVIIIFTLILSSAISLSGFIFAYLEANFLLIFLLYCVIGGKSHFIEFHDL